MMIVDYERPDRCVETNRKLFYEYVISTLSSICRDKTFDAVDCELPLENIARSDNYNSIFVEDRYFEGIPSLVASI